jgi:hypothetical protein
LRIQAATHMIMGFLPRDVIEATLAGHCVMFHELMTNTVHTTLRGEVDTARRGTRAGIIAMDKAFANNLARLEHYRLRPSQGQRDVAEARPADAQVAAEIRQPEAQAAPPSGQSASAATPPAETPEIPAIAQPEPALAATDPVDGTTVTFRPSPAVIAECRANPEAMAALDAGDPERFARAMGLDMPTEADLAAADPGSIFALGSSGIGLSAASSGGPRA